MTDDATHPPRPWWRYSYVWLVISGPAVVAVAGAVTVWLAVQGADPIVAHDYYKRGIEINKTLADKALMPAVQGRNHAVTPAPGAR